MIFKVFCVLHVFLIQVIIISAQLFSQDLSSQNVLNNLANLPLARYGRSRRQVNSPPVGLPGNGIANALQLKSGMPFGNFPRGNGLPNSWAFNNGLPNGLAFNNGLPNNFAINNGMTLPNNSPLNVPFPNINNVPQNRLLPSINGINNNGLSFNNIPNGLPKNNNLPVANKFPYNNVPAENNILNLNNLPTANLLPNMNIMPINGLPSLNNPPCGNAIQQINGLPLNNMPFGNILSPINNRLPNINNFRITGIGIGNGIADINRFPRNHLQDGNGLLSNANNLQNANELAEASEGLANINNNGFSSVTNTPASSLPNNMPVNDRFSNINHFMYHNGVSNIASEAQNMNNMQLPDVSNFQYFNVMPINQQRFVNNVPPSNSFAVRNNFPVNTAVPANNRLVNAITTGLPFSNGGYSNDISFGNNNGMAFNTPESFLQINNGHEFPSNDFQFRNIQVPLNNWHYDFGGANMPGDQNLPEGVQMFSNVLNDYQSALTSNNFNLAQELVKNLQVEGLGNMPFLNGLPVAGITETVTFLNGPYDK